ncbi:MAG: hypothetical protein RL757_616 [Bacteroidota bacterium]|jgi:hypothetical protein
MRPKKYVDYPKMVVNFGNILGGGYFFKIF